MNQDLRRFYLEWLRVAGATLAPVLLIAFVSMPAALGRHPGEPATPAPVSQWHPT